MRKRQTALMCNSTESATFSNPAKALAGTVTNREAPEFVLRLHTVRQMATAVDKVQEITEADRRYHCRKLPCSRELGRGLC